MTFRDAYLCGILILKSCDIDTPGRSTTCLLELQVSSHNSCSKKKKLKRAD